MLDALNHRGHGAAWDAVFYPKLDRLVRYIARLANRHGLLLLRRTPGADTDSVSGGVWTVDFRGGFDGAKAWLEAVAATEKMEYDSNTSVEHVAVAAALSSH